MLTGLPQTGIELAEIISRELQRIVDWRRYGDSWSNEAISRCFAELLRPTPENQTNKVLIFDPCVGSGSDLLAVSERWPEASLFGAEINRLRSDVTNFLFTLRGHRIEITNTDSLRENTLEKQTADIALAFHHLVGDSIKTCAIILNGHMAIQDQVQIMHGSKLC